MRLRRLLGECETELREFRLKVNASDEIVERLIFDEAQQLRDMLRLANRRMDEYAALADLKNHLSGGNS